MIRIAYIQTDRDGRLSEGSHLVAEELKERRVQFELFAKEQMRRRQVPVHEDAFVVGDRSCVRWALKRLNLAPPRLNPYPDVLTDLLGRRTWRTTLGAVQARFRYGAGEPVFVRPASATRLFPPSVFSRKADFKPLESVSPRRPVVCSEVVEWVSQWRAYVVRGRVRALGHVGGDPTVEPEAGAPRRAAQLFATSGLAPRGYAFDFGVLASGETALVQVLDGYGLKAKGVGRQAYTDLLLARWEELLAPLRPVAPGGG